MGASLAPRGGGDEQHDEKSHAMTYEPAHRGSRAALATTACDDRLRRHGRSAQTKHHERGAIVSHEGIDARFGQRRIQAALHFLIAIEPEGEALHLKDE